MYYHLLDNKDSFKNKVNVHDTYVYFEFLTQSITIFDFATYV